MKFKILILMLLTFQMLQAQAVQDTHTNQCASEVTHDCPSLIEDGGLLFEHNTDGEDIKCDYTREKSRQDWEALRSNRERLIAEGKVNLMMPPPVLYWPLRPDGSVYAPGYYVTSNQVDLDGTSGAANILDYNGGTRTYDGHTGIDLRIWPFYWTMMDNNEVSIIAAADGVIVNIVDGNFDRNCSFAGAGAANRVDVLHDGGYTTQYLHMKSGSTTTKQIGDPVRRGEYLGLVGSSGVSTNPHLHFGVLDEMGNTVEPYFGPSNPTLPATLWNVQKPYLESSIVKLMTHSATPSLNNCPVSNDTPNEQNHFNPGDNITFGTYYMAPQNGHSATYTVLNPTGGTQWTWNTNFTQTFTRNAQNFNTFTLPSFAASGTWTFRVFFSGNNQTAEHFFTVGCVSSYNLTGNHSDGDGYIASDFITSTATVSSNDDRVHYEAGDYIQLSPGFRATDGCSFRTRIDNCSVGGQ